MLAARPARTNLTLAQVLFPQQTLLRHAAVVIAASMFIAVSAQVSIVLPIGPVPITAQTFAVLLVGGTLGSRLGLAAAALYLAEGIVGLPVFASGHSGWAIIVGASGGYLVSYPFTTALVGWLAERGWNRRPVTMAAAMLLGSAVIYAVGLPWLYAWGTLHTGLLKVDQMTVALTLKLGLLPFIPGDLAKLLLAAGLVPSAWQLLHVLGVSERGEAHEAPTGLRVTPFTAAAALLMAAGAALPWSPGVLGIAHAGGQIVLAAGLLGALGAVLRMTRVIGPGAAQLIGFAAGATGGLLAFVNLVVFTKAGELALADISGGVAVCLLAAVILLATTALDAAAE